MTSNKIPKSNGPKNLKWTGPFSFEVLEPDRIKFLHRVILLLHLKYYLFSYLIIFLFMLFSLKAINASLQSNDFIFKYYLFSSSIKKNNSTYAII